MSKKIEEIILEFERIIQKEFPELIKEEVEKEPLQIRFIKKLIQLSNIYSDADEKYQKKIQFIEDLIIIIYGDYEKYILNGGDTIIISDSKDLLKNFLNYHIEKNQYSLVLKILEDLISIYIKIILEDKIDFEYYNSIYNLKEFIIKNKWNKSQEIIKLCLGKLDEKFKIGNLIYIKYFLIGLNPLNKEIFYDFVSDNFLNEKLKENINMNNFDTISFYSYLIKIIEDLSNNSETNNINNYKEMEKIQLFKKYIEEKNEKKKNTIIKPRNDKNKQFQLFVEIPKNIDIKNIDFDIVNMAEKFLGGEVKGDTINLEEIKIKKPIYCQKFNEIKPYFYGKICQIILKGLLGKLTKTQIINIIEKEIEKIEIPELFLFKEILTFLYKDKNKKILLSLLFFNENQNKYLKGILLEEINQYLKNKNIKNSLENNEMFNWEILINLLILIENVKKLKKSKSIEKEEKINNIIDKINKYKVSSKKNNNILKKYIQFLHYYLRKDLNENNIKYSQEQLINLLKLKLNNDSQKIIPIKLLLNFSFLKNEFIYQHLNNFYPSKFNKNHKEFFLYHGIITLIKAILSLENLSIRDLYNIFLNNIFLYHQESKDKIIFFECLVYLENNFLNPKEHIPFAFENFYMIFRNKHYSEIMKKICDILLQKNRSIPSSKIKINLLDCKWNFNKKRISKKNFADYLFYFLTDFNKLFHEKNFDKLIDIKEDILETFDNFDIINKDKEKIQIEIIEFSFENLNKKKIIIKKEQISNSTGWNIKERNKEKNIKEEKYMNKNNDLSNLYSIMKQFQSYIYIEKIYKKYNYYRNIRKYFKKQNKKSNINTSQTNIYKYKNLK